MIYILGLNVRFTYREVLAVTDVGDDSLRLLLEDALDGDLLVADHHGHGGGVLVALGRLNADASGGKACDVSERRRGCVRSGCGFFSVLGFVAEPFAPHDWRGRVYFVSATRSLLRDPGAEGSRRGRRTLDAAETRPKRQR